MGQKGDKTKELICHVAFELFAEKGFKDVTMQDICCKTGLSRGGLYRHFESTQQIFMEIVSGMMENQRDEFADKIRCRVPAVAILEDVLKRYEDEMIDSGHSLSLAIYEFFSNPGIDGGGVSILQQYQASRAMWTGLIEYGISTGEFMEVDPDAVFDVIVFSYQGVRMYSKLMTVGRDIPQRITGQIRRLLMNEG